MGEVDDASIDKLVFAILNSLDSSEAWSYARQDPEALRLAARHGLSRIVAAKDATIARLRADLAECEADHPTASELEDARAVIAMLRSEYARRYEDWKARTEALEAGLAEACDMAEAGRGCAYPKTPERVARDLTRLRSLLTPKETT